MPFEHHEHPVKWYRRVLSLVTICAVLAFILLAVSYSTTEQKQDRVEILEYELDQLATELATKELLYEGALEQLVEMQHVIDEQTATIDALREGATRLSEQLP